jgi:prophage regulatory protein
MSATRPPIVGLTEFQEMLVDLTRGRVEEITFRAGFPAPVAELASGDVWLLADVQAWIAEHPDVLVELMLNPGS